jgi:hypothetical protein
MLYLNVFTPKKNLTKMEINSEKEMWGKKCRDRCIHDECKTLCRYETQGDEPAKIFFMIDADKPISLDLLSHHFGDAWNSEVYPVRRIYDVVDNDCAIIAG